MPRVRRRAKSRRAGYTQWHIVQLERGYDMFGDCAFGNNEDMDVEAIKAAWAVLGEKIMASWIKQHPGQRPWCWWFIEAKEPRRRVDNVIHPFNDRLRKSLLDSMPDHYWVKRH